MAKGDLIITSGLVILGILITIGSYGLGLWESGQPGVGLMPCGLGILLVSCSFPILLRSFATLTKSVKQREPGVWSGVQLKKVGLVTGSLFCYLVLLEKAGFVVTAFLVFFVLFKAVGSQKWGWALMATILTVGLSYLLFVVFLDVYMPSFPFWDG